MNNTVKCTVKQCQHHATKDDFCTLNQISVGANKANPTCPECTDCNSFKVRQ